MINPLITVAIPVYNEESNISDCLRSILNQTYENIEIIVVDDGSTDRTYDIIKNDFPTVRLFQQEHSGPGAAWNLAAKESKGKIFLIVGADSELEKNYVKLIIDPIVKGKAWSTKFTNDICSNLDNPIARCFALTEKERQITKEREERDPEAFSAILTEKYLEYGGLDPKRGYADDRTIYDKTKIPPVAVPGAIVYHKMAATWHKVFKQLAWLGKTYTMSRITHGKKSRRFGLLFLIILFIIGYVVFSVSYPKISLYIIIGVFGLYLLFLLKVLIKRVSSDFWIHYFYLYPIFYTVKVISYFYGVLNHLVTGKNTR